VGIGSLQQPVPSLLLNRPRESGASGIFRAIQPSHGYEGLPRLREFKVASTKVAPLCVKS
jgi:hypothetical protein